MSGNDHRGYNIKQQAQAVEQGKQALCVERCLATLPKEEIHKLTNAGHGECPQCHQHGQLRFR